MKGSQYMYDMVLKKSQALFVCDGEKCPGNVERGEAGSDGGEGGGYHAEGSKKQCVAWDPFVILGGGG